MGCGELFLGSVRPREEPGWGGRWAAEPVSPRGGEGKLGSHFRLQVSLGFHWLEWGTESRGYRSSLVAVTFPSPGSDLGTLSPILVIDRDCMCVQVCLSKLVYLWAQVCLCMQAPPYV